MAYFSLEGSYETFINDINKPFPAGVPIEVCVAYVGERKVSYEIEEPYDEEEREVTVDLGLYGEIVRKITFSNVWERKLTKPKTEVMSYLEYCIGASTSKTIILEEKIVTIASRSSRYHHCEECDHEAKDEDLAVVVTQVPKLTIHGDVDDIAESEEYPYAILTRISGEEKFSLNRFVIKGTPGESLDPIFLFQPFLSSPKFDEKSLLETVPKSRKDLI